MRTEIKYLGFYDLPNVISTRVSTVAAINKMDYIAETLIQAGFDVNIVSPSWSSDNDVKAIMQKGGVIQISPNKRITFAPTFSARNKCLEYFKIIFSLVWLFLWLLKNVKRNEKIIVYHVQWLSLPLRLARRIKKFHMILEVEEFYGKVWKNKYLLERWENSLIASADTYIAVSDILANKLGVKTKAVVYGNYMVPDVVKSKPYFTNNRINVVYAGSIDDTKGGACKAVECAALLPENYLVHISGHGDELSIIRLCEKIEKTNKELGREACVFHGSISNENFVNFLQSCQIALNPQFTGEQFSYLFPSKIIKYLALNLRVVSTGIESIENSAIAEFILFSKNDSTQCIVEKIMAVDFSIPYNSKKFITELHLQFLYRIKKELFI